MKNRKGEKVGKKEFGENSQLHKTGGRMEISGSYDLGKKTKNTQKSCLFEKGMREENARHGEGRANNLVGSKERFTHLSEKQDPCWNKLKVSVLSRGDHIKVEAQGSSVFVTYSRISLKQYA